MKTDKMTFKFTEEEAKFIRNALANMADIYKDEKKAQEAERLHELFYRRLQDHKKGE